MAITNLLVGVRIDMEQFHNHFKYEFRKIWNDAADVDPDEPESLEEFLDEADGLYSHLSAHHGIEVRPFIHFLYCVFDLTGRNCAPNLTCFLPLMH